VRASAGRAGYFRRVTSYVATTAAVGALALTGCSGGEEDSPAAASSGPPIIQPGAPGEESSTIAPDEVPSGEAYNHTDVAFMQMMIPHHGQALTMTRLAPARAESPAVKRLAARIKGAQGPEIITMGAWLEKIGVEVPKVTDDPMSFDHGQHGHQRMAGMLSEKQLAALRQARGVRFDRLFLTGMIGHHRGAIEMAQSVQEGGSDARAIEMADDIVATQSAEIATMKRLLKQL